jgi:hypothetical protein
MVLRLMRREQGFPVEGFDADKHLKASGPCEQVNQLFLLRDLRIALDEEGDLDFSAIMASSNWGPSAYLLKLSDVNMIAFTPAALAARRLAMVTSISCERMARPAILITEQKLHVKGHPRAG